MIGDDEQVRVKHSAGRLKVVKRKDPELAAALKEAGYTNARIIGGKTAGGEEIAWITNLEETIGAEELRELYRKRWEIEKKYDTLKNKMKIESTTGKACCYVYQDFWAQLLVYNMLSDMKMSAEEAVSEARAGKALNYPMRIHENMAVGLFKEQLVHILLEGNSTRRDIMLRQLQEEMERYIFPYRPPIETPVAKRAGHTANKYRLNFKPGF
jgi:hypothetical protein